MSIKKEHGEGGGLAFDREFIFQHFYLIFYQNSHANLILSATAGTTYRLRTLTFSLPGSGKKIKVHQLGPVFWIQGDQISPKKAISTPSGQASFLAVTQSQLRQEKVERFVQGHLLAHVQVVL
jgi:hypothetical protein